MNAASITIRGLSVRLGGQRVLDQFDLNIRRGERLLIAGPSGSGKSTLLRAIAGLIPIESGEIRINDRPVQGLKPGDRGIGMVFQQAALLPHLTVLDNLCFGLRARGSSRRDARARAQDMAELLEVTPHLAKRPRELSGGEQQRVALGRALLRDGGLILLDEPLSQLDAPLRARLRSELLRLQQATGSTWLHVTHDQQEALSLADRLGVMRAGRLLQLDAPRRLYQQPANSFVASFIGAPGISLIALQKTASGWTWQDRAVPAPAASRDCDQLLLGLRPEHLHPAAADDKAFEARLQAREHLGERDLLSLSLHSGETLRMIVPADAPATEWLRLQADFDAASWFDGATGQRID